MRWLTALRRMTRNGIDTPMRRALSTVPVQLGVVPITGHGGLTDRELASAGASIAVPPEHMTVDQLHSARERLEAFVERQADVASRTLRGSYWDLQSAEISASDEARSLATEMARQRRVEGAAVVGWVIRNAAQKAQRPIATLARPVADGADIDGDALDLASTLLDSPQRLDPTDGGFLLSPEPRHGSRWRSRGRFGYLWVYGD